MQVPLIEKPDARIVEVRTEDGATVSCRRYARPGARAVVCGHGLASSGYEFDLPLAGFNLADVLYRLGYEVWIINFRGSGSYPWISDAGDWHHSGDQLGCFDLPAVIDRAAEETGRPVFYMGHSFGGMALYMYLQGCVIDSARPMVRQDPEVAARRNSLVAGAVAVASPVSMDEGTDLMDRMRLHPATQAGFRFVEAWLRKRDRKHPRIPIGEMALEFGYRHPLLAKIIMSSPLMQMYLVPWNMGGEACRLFGTWAGGDVSALQVAQTVQTVRLGQLDCTMQQEEEVPSYCYKDGMSAITAPLVAASGGKDFLQPKHIRDGVIETVSSEHTLEVSIPGAGHVDLLYQIPVVEIVEWLEEHAAAD